MKTWMRPLPIAFALLAALSLLILIGAIEGLDRIGSAPFSVVIDGERVFDGTLLAGLSGFEQLVLAALALVAVLVALLIVPVVLLLVGLAVGFVVLLAVGLPLAAVALVLAVLLSPLLLLAWLLWKLLAPSSSIA